MCGPNLRWSDDPPAEELLVPVDLEYNQAVRNPEKHQFQISGYPQRIKARK